MPREYLKYGGVYLDTDVEVLCRDPFNKYLKYDNVIPFENARGINSGMMFLAVRGSELCKKMINCYSDQLFDKDHLVLNTQMNKSVIDSFCDGLKYNNMNQIFGNTFIMSSEEYEEQMRHYGMRTWCDNLPKYTIRNPNKLINILRSPAILERLEKHPKFLKIYQFIAYDLYDLGFGYFIRLQINKRKNKQ